MSEDWQVYVNGEMVPWNEASISVFDRGFQYGDGVFEGIRFYNGHPFRLGQHLDRLALSARAIALELPYGLQALAGAVEDTIAAFGRDDGYLRLVVTRGIGPMGLDPRGCGRPSVFMIAGQIKLVGSSVRQRGARLVVVATRRLSPDARSLTNRLSRRFHGAVQHRMLR